MVPTIEFFKSTFPNGLIVSGITSDENTARSGGAPWFFIISTARYPSEGTTPVFGFLDPDGRERLAAIQEVHDRGDGFWFAERKGHDVVDLLLSSNLTEEQRQFVALMRSESQ